MASTKSIFFINLLVQICSIGTHIFYIEGASLPKFPAILIFGDSLVDTGNNNFIMTFFKANHGPYGISFPNCVPTGRFSNGKLMSDLLASALGIKDLVPPFLDPNLPNDELKTGVCFASAGSGYDDMTTVASNVIPVSKQLDYFKQYIEKLKSAVGEEQANETISNALVFAVAGSNDYLLNFYISPTRRAQFGAGGYQDYLQKRIQDFVKVIPFNILIGETLAFGVVSETALYDLGCRNFMIAGIPPLADALSYNQKLMALLPNIQSSLPGSKFVYADIARPLLEMTINPARYGLLVLTFPCCGGGFGDCSAFSLVCPNPNQYLRWDSVHPTEAAYKVMAQYLQDNALTQFSR